MHLSGSHEATVESVCWVSKLEQEGQEAEGVWGAAPHMQPTWGELVR